ELRVQAERAAMADATAVGAVAEPKAAWEIELERQQAAEQAAQAGAVHDPAQVRSEPGAPLAAPEDGEASPVDVDEPALVDTERPEPSIEDVELDDELDDDEYA